MVLGLDIGDCLSRRDVPSADGDLCYRSAAKGAYAFLVLFTAKYGADSVHLISKTNSGQWYSWRGDTRVEAWVVRFAKQFGLPECGVPEDHIHVTKHKSGKYGKGLVAKDLGLTHMVDNDMECLWSVLFDPVGNASDTLEQVIQFTSLQPRALPNRGTWPQDAQHRMVRLHTWHDVAMYFDLTRHPRDLWDTISRHGPPHCPPMRPTSKEMVKLARILAASAGAAAALADDDDAPPPASSPAPASKAKWGGIFAPRRPGRRAATATSAEPPPSDNNLDDEDSGVLAAKKIAALAAEVSALKDEMKRTTLTAEAAAIKAEAVAVAVADAAQRSSGAGSSRDPAPSAAPPRPKAAGAAQEDPSWAHWRSAAIHGRSWLNKKARRAELHSKGILPSRGASTRTVQRSMCLRNQPGTYCDLQLCGICCQMRRRNTDDGYWQHDVK